MKKTLLDTSSEFIIERFYNGVKLIAPKSSDNSNPKSVFNIMQLPFNVYFVNTESIIQNINEHTIESAGYLSIKDSLGKTVSVVAKKKAADFSLAHDALVLTTNAIQVAFDFFERKTDNAAFSAMSIKYPWYNQDNKLIGVFGCSLLPKADNPFSLTESLALLLQLGLLDKNSLSHHLPHNNLYDTNSPSEKIPPKFTKRQQDCLFHLVQGMTIKQIAKCLSLSPRTVEHYLENIKRKVNAHSRIDLVAKAIEKGLI